MNISQRWLLYWKEYTLKSNMEHIIQMTAMAGSTVAHSVDPIFQYIFDCLALYFVNGNFDFMFQVVNRLLMISVTLVLNGS